MPAPQRQPNGEPPVVEVSTSGARRFLAARGAPGFSPSQLTPRLEEIQVANGTQWKIELAGHHANLRGRLNGNTLNITLDVRANPQPGQGAEVLDFTGIPVFALRIGTTKISGKTELTYFATGVAQFHGPDSVLKMPAYGEMKSPESYQLRIPKVFAVEERKTDGIKGIATPTLGVRAKIEHSGGDAHDVSVTSSEPRLAGKKAWLGVIGKDGANLGVVEASIGGEKVSLRVPLGAKVILAVAPVANEPA